MPDALSSLIAPLRSNPLVIAAFGKQYIASHAGDILHSQSAASNARYFKTDDRAGRVQSSVWSVVAGQFPPDGYLARTDAVRRTPYRDEPDVGEACGADFGYRLSRLGDFFLVADHTSAYRVTQDSISSRGLQVLLSKKYFLMEKLSIPADLEQLRRSQLRDLAPVAVNGCLLTSARAQALKILFGKNYPWNRQFIRHSILSRFCSSGRK